MTNEERRGAVANALKVGDPTGPDGIDGHPTATPLITR